MNRLLSAAIFAGAALGLAGPPCLAMTRSVNCDEGKTIQAAVDTATTRADRLEIFVTGTCNEDITIRRAAVTIDGGGVTTIVGRVSVFADNVWLYNLTITGPGRGVNIGAGGNARLWSVALIGNEGAGLRTSSNASVWVRDSHIEGNTGPGISAQASQIRVANTSVSNNGSHGIELTFNSQADIGDCDIYDNADVGILLTAGSQANIDGNTIHHNSGSGVHGHLSTTIVMHGNVVQDNAASGVSGFGRTTIQIGGAQINYNGDDGVSLSAGSTLILEEPETTLTGNTNAALWCGDAQSFVNDLSLLVTDQPKGCLEFTW